MHALVEDAAQVHSLRLQYTQEGQGLWRYLRCGVNISLLPE